MKKIGIIGSGIVAQVLAKGLIKHGYNVMVGSGDKAKRDQLKIQTGALTGSFIEAANFGEILVLAVKGTASEMVVKNMSGSLKGKTVIDVNNPIDDKPPVNGVIQYFTSSDESLLERLQKLSPEANFVKAFNSVGNAFMIDPAFESKPTMFICGNNDQAKKDVRDLVENVGWEVDDMGKAESARAIEPLCMLWCIPGLLKNEWNHTFKMLKKN